MKHPAARTYLLQGELRYFTRTRQNKYSAPELLEDMAAFIRELPELHTVEQIMTFPERNGWSGVVLVYPDKPQPLPGRPPRLTAKPKEEE